MSLHLSHLSFAEAKRVAIIGNSGSGKTTLARQLGESKEAAVLDLDTVAWQPGKIAVARSVTAAREDVRGFCTSNDAWVIEGCYTSLVAAGLEFRPHLLVLDPGKDRCVSNCRARPWEPHKYPSKEAQDDKLSYLLQWIRGYYSRGDDLSLMAHKRLFERYAGPKTWLSSLPASAMDSAESP
jgi:adenylate kinase family enzyme